MKKTHLCVWGGREGGKGRGITGVGGDERGYKVKKDRKKEWYNKEEENSDSKVGVKIQ